MMKVFISYSHNDKEIAVSIGDILRNAGHDIWMAIWKIAVGDNIIEKINKGIKDADAIIMILSNSSLNSKWTFREFSAMVLGDLSREDRKIVPIVIDKSSVPSYLSNYKYINLTNNFDEGIRELLSGLSEEKKNNQSTLDNDKFYEKAHTEDKKILARSLSEGRLTLVCGAGISVSAGSTNMEHTTK